MQEICVLCVMYIFVLKKSFFFFCLLSECGFFYWYYQMCCQLYRWRRCCDALVMMTWVTVEATKVKIIQPMAGAIYQFYIQLRSTQFMIRLISAVCLVDLLYQCTDHMPPMPLTAWKNCCERLWNRLTPTKASDKHFLERTQTVWKINLTKIIFFC